MSPGGGGPPGAGPTDESLRPTSGGSHGDHWQGVMGERVGEVLGLAQAAFRRPVGRGTVRQEGRVLELALARAEAAPGVDLLAASLDGALATAFPVVKDAAPGVPATLLTVAPWPSGLEAWAEVHVEGLGYVTFFPVDYVTSQARYHEGAAGEARVRVSLSGLAYTLSPGTEAEADDLAPASDMVPKAYPDDYWWCGTIERVHPLGDGYVAYVRVEPEEGARLELPIYVRGGAEGAFRPREGERASGFLWLQGRLEGSAGGLVRP